MIDELQQWRKDNGVVKAKNVTSKKITMTVEGMTVIRELLKKKKKSRKRKTKMSC